MYNRTRIVFDPLKNRINREKHGVTFSDLETFFADERAITIEDNDHAEQRWLTLGSDAAGRILVVAYTWRSNVIRIISARRASCAERRRYEEQ